MVTPMSTNQKLTNDLEIEPQRRWIAIDNKLEKNHTFPDHFRLL